MIWNAIPTGNVNLLLLSNNITEVIHLSISTKTKQFLSNSHVEKDQCNGRQILVLKFSILIVTEI